MITPADITRGKRYPLLILERLLSHRARHRLHSIVGFSLSFLVVLEVLVYVIDYMGLLSNDIRLIAAFLVPKVAGLALILTSVWLVIFAVEGFFRSFYFKETEVPQTVDYYNHEADLLSFEVGRILASARKNGGDITRGFILSEMGKRVLLRSGITLEDQNYFLGVRNQATYAIDIAPLQQKQLFTLPDLVQIMVAKDPEFAEFLFARGIKEEELVGAAIWVRNENEDAKQKERWWTKDSLSQIPGIGKDWAYGGAYKLERYAVEVSGTQYVNSYRMNMVKRQKELRQLEAILARTSESNALIVGDPGTGVMDLVRIFAHRVQTAVVAPVLEHKRVMLLDSNALIAGTGEKALFESQLIELFEDAAEAGNVILVIKNLPEFILSARALGSNIVDVLDPYFASPAIQIIATTDKDNLLRLLERNAELVKQFEKVTLDEPNHDGVLQILEHAAREFEETGAIFFTYPAIAEMVQSAEQYLTVGVMPDKALDLLIEIVPVVAQKHKLFVTKDDVLELIQTKTNIPVGKINASERDKLTHLEEFLHRRVIGQDEAINMVSNAMRRARAGVRNLNRPIGTFLFLGPTGVGKTETTKALAEAFFESEDKIIRLDMSEYRGMGALTRLIGSFETGEVGTLARLVREQPYGVLLLDEFEKTTPDVHDLFLQILDEGFFSDAFGKKVNARNMIIVATSNAGSDIIWEITQKNDGDLASHKNALIEELIKEGTFKPELLNRFDGIVLFHPLAEDHLKKIAQVMLEKFAKRLREQNNIELFVDAGVVSYVASNNYNKSFGARPMNRFIQEHIEQKIANLIISGDLAEGQKIKMSETGEVLPVRA